MGRPSKGERHRINLRVPMRLYVALAQRSERAGVDLNTYCEAILTRHVRQGAPPESMSATESEVKP